MHRNIKSHNAIIAKDMGIMHCNAGKEQHVANATKKDIAQMNAKASIINAQDAMEITQRGTTNAPEESKKANDERRPNDKHPHIFMNNATSKTQNKNNIAILQYNLNKNKTTTHSVLNHPSTTRFAIIALQEQYWSSYTESSLKHQSWTLIESTQ